MTPQKPAVGAPGRRSLWSFRPGRSLPIIPARCPEDRGCASPDGALTPPGQQGARAAAPGRPSARASALEPARRFLFRGSAEGRAGPGCRRERGYIRARQAARVPLGGRRGSSYRGVSGFSLRPPLLTHRCSLSRRNKSVRKPHRSHGESGASRSGLGGWVRAVPGWREETGLACPGKGAGERARTRKVIGCLQGASLFSHLWDNRLLKTPERLPWSPRWRSTGFGSLSPAAT